MPDEDLLSIFVIGPMGNDRAHHTAAIKAGVEQALDKIKYAGPREVTIPDALEGSSVVDDVFHKIDTADLAIADISNRSPNVFYEIALFDTLGTPTIMLDELPSGQERLDLPFYWTQTRVHQVPGFSANEVAAKLETVLKTYLAEQAPINLTANPITKFYDVPLVDVSAASGLAVGYYDNFIRHMLMEKQGVLALAENKLKNLVVLRPLRVEGFQEDEDAIKELFPAATGFTANAPTQRRGNVFLSRVDKGVVLDIPTPIYSLQQAPRFKTLRRRLEQFQNLDDKASDEILRKLEERMIGAFFKTLDFLLRFERGLSRRKLAIRTLDELKSAKP